MGNIQNRDEPLSQSNNEFYWRDELIEELRNMLGKNPMQQTITFTPSALIMETNNPAQEDDI